MYLKNIEVQGFKSFAQKINFEFHNGITGIVGPNGSGKSNVADAVRWVLGEQSAKQLRGGNMQDVIFSGTQTRKPLSFASVAITMDNSDHKLPVDYEEVTVTRRLYRSGESEYLINGSACRLRDINEMFYDTGIGKEGYSIIGQGQIDKILSGKPEDRRELFDEAAGIVKFKRRKNTTLKKLEEEQQNLVRVTDILTELTRQLGPLEKQSESARQYLARREEQRSLDVNLFLLESEKTREELDAVEDKLRTAAADLEETTGEYDRTKEEYQQLETTLQEMDDQISKARDEAQDKALKRQQLSSQADILQEQILASEKNQSLRRERLDAIREGLSKQEALYEELQTAKAEISDSLRQLDEKAAQTQQRLTQIQSQIVDCEKAVQDSKQEIMDLLGGRAKMQGMQERYKTLMEQIDIRKARVSQRILVLQSDRQQQAADMKNARGKYDTITDMIRRMNEESARLQGQVEELTLQIHKAGDQIQAGQAAFHRESSRLESLRNMAERYDGYGGSIRRVMEQKDKEPGILGVVADLIQVDKAYEIAVETALGGSIQNIVTDNEQTAKRMIGFLKKNRLGRATFLPLDALTVRGEFGPAQALKEKGVIGVASELVHTDPAFERLAGYLLGRVLVVDNIDHAIALAGKYRHSLRIVTLEGESLSPGGSMTGGAFKNNSNLLGRRREIDELQASIQALEKDLKAAEDEVSDKRSRRNVLRDTLADLGEKLRLQYVEQNTAQMEIQAQQEKAGALEEEAARISREQETLRTDVQKLEEEHEQIRSQMEASEKDEGELQAYIETREGELQMWRDEESTLSDELDGLRMQLVASREQESFSQENLERVRKDRDQLLQEQDEILHTLEAEAGDKENRQQQIVSLKDACRSLEESEGALRTQITQWSGQREEYNTRFRSFFSLRDELSGRINLLDKECLRLKTQKERLDEAQETRISYLWEEYEITPALAASMKAEEPGSIREMKKQLAAVREAIRALGPVNVSAIEEYKEVKERHTFLSGQYNDLKEAAESLAQIIQELDEGMRRQFTEKFREIQQEFDQTFKELFGGGKGTLALEEDADILEAGIHIISQPPGKKLQNMMQLSGGEKALTAIALLFAIQNLKPSPFCLLDEIEAALDDSNVGRFAGYLQKLTKYTQFIVITHRRGTMNAADRLYGITMQEKGVSALVSVDLVENQLSQ